MHLRKGDNWTNTATVVTTVSSFISVYFWVVGCFDALIPESKEKNICEMTFGLSLALISTYGVVHNIRQGHIRSESILEDVEEENDIESQLSESLIDQSQIEKLTIHENFVIFGICISHLGNAIFPVLFTLNEIVINEIPEPAKITLFSVATLYGIAGCVAPYRTAKKCILENRSLLK